jgi:hypothetical protein
MWTILSNPKNEKKEGKEQARNTHWWLVIREETRIFTHSEAPETRVATRAKAYDLYLTLARKAKPTVEKMIDPPRAEVGSYVD